MLNPTTINFDKLNGLVPAVVQDADNSQVLMVGFMNPAALKKTLETKTVTFYSRTRQRLWTKGAEESGNFLRLVDIQADCDRDSLLIIAKPDGPTCHTGSISCFGQQNNQTSNILFQLEDLIKQRKKRQLQGSYVSSLFESGLDRIAQKVGEEGVEVVIAAKNDNQTEFVSESADLLFHWLVLCAEKEVGLVEVIEELKKRQNKAHS